MAKHLYNYGTTSELSNDNSLTTVMLESSLLLQNPESYSDYHNNHHNNDYPSIDCSSYPNNLMSSVSISTSGSDIYDTPTSGIYALEISPNVNPFIPSVSNQPFPVPFPSNISSNLPLSVTSGPNCSPSVLPSSTSHQANATLQWLEINFFERDSVSVSRSTIYDLYVRFCELNYFSSVCKATFGKLIRSKFANVKSKRLGARGQSKYHYYNISFRDPQKRCFMRIDSGGQFEEKLTGNTTSPAVLSIMSHNGQDEEYPRLVSSMDPIRRLTSGTDMEEYEERDRMLTIFSAKPVENDVTSFNLNGSDYHGVIQAMLSFMKVPMVEPLTEQKSVFINLYRIHCQCLIESALCSNFGQLRHYFIHFWKQLPLSLIDIESMRTLDYKMLELIEMPSLSNIDDWDSIQWTQIVNINTMLQLIPEWLRILIDNESFNHTTDDQSDSMNVSFETIFETKLQISQSIASRYRFKVEFLFILEQLTNLEMFPIVSYLQELCSCYLSSTTDSISGTIALAFSSFLTKLAQHSKLRKCVEKPSSQRCFIDALDAFFRSVQAEAHPYALPVAIYTQISQLLKIFERLILDDELMQDCDEFEDVTSEEEFEVTQNSSVEYEFTSGPKSNQDLHNNVRLFLFAVDNYCIEICQNFSQKSQF